MSNPSFPECGWVRQRLLDDHGEALSPVPEMAAHLAQCKSCREFAVHWRRAVAARRQLGQVTLSERDVDRMWARLEPRIDTLIRGAEGARRARWWPPWPRLRWLSVAAAAAGIATVVVASRLISPPSPPPAIELARVVEPVGPVEIVDGARARVATAASPTPLGITEMLRTGVGGRARLRVGVHDIVAMPQTEIILATLAPTEVGFDLRGGSAVMSVEPGSAKRFWMRSPRGRIEVSGTVFAAETTSSEDRVTVLRGSVRVSSPRVEQALSVKRGFCAHLTDEGISIEPIAAGVERRWQQALAPAAEGDAGLSMSPPAAAPKPEEPRLGRRSSRAAGTKRSSAADEGEPPPLAALEAALADGDCDLALAVAQTSELRVDDPTRAEVLMRVADCQVAAGAPAKALAAYQLVARQYPRAIAGQNATYESGRLALELGDQDLARRAFQDYLARYPRGTLAPEALYRICVLDMEAKRADDALSCLKRYRQKHPRGGRANEALLAQATIQRTLKHDCRAAIETYDRYLAGAGERAEEARTWREWCEKKARP